MKTAGKGSTKTPSCSVQAVSHSRWRHIGTYVVAFSSVLGPVKHSLGEFLVEGPLLAVVPTDASVPPLSTLCGRSSASGLRRQNRPLSRVTVRSDAS